MTMKHKLLVLHATLLLREYCNNPLSKPEQMALFDKQSDDELKDYIDNFNDIMAAEMADNDYDEYEDYIRSRRYDEDDYGPGCPWKAPGMSIADFI